MNNFTAKIFGKDEDEFQHVIVRVEYTAQGMDFVIMNPMHFQPSDVLTDINEARISAGLDHPQDIVYSFIWDMNTYVVRQGNREYKKIAI